MKNLLFLSAAILLFTVQSCRKSDKDCYGCGGGQNPPQQENCVTINTIVANNDTVIVNTTVGDSLFRTVTITHTVDTVINTVCNGVAQATQYGYGPQWTETYTNFNGTNNSGGGGNNPPIATVYVMGVTTPNATNGGLNIGDTYWGFTSVPAACAHSAYDEPCNPIAIKITGVAGGKYTYTTYPSTTFSNQNGYYPYIKADSQGGAQVKNAISGALLINNYPFVVVSL